MPTSFVAKAVPIVVALTLGVAGCSGSGRSESPIPALPVNAQFALRTTTAVSTHSVMRTEMPMFADGFVDSIGVNTHFSWGPYASRFDAVKSLLLSLGLRHIRDGLQHYDPFYAHLVELARAGVHTTITTRLNDSMEDIASYTGHLPGVIEAFEGPNEPNNSADWLVKVRAFQHNLYRTLKGNASTAWIPVIGPALAWRLNDWAQLGDISRDLDYGNIHDYFGGQKPGDGTIERNINAAQSASGSKPIVTSETGYCTSGGAQAVTADVMGVYVPRMFLEQYMNGIPRTLEYEFIDESSGTSDLWLNCGLLKDDLTPKPAYHALKNVIADLADRGPWFARSSLTFEFSDTASDIRHALLQKRDGSYYLAVWLEDSAFNVQGRYQVPVTSRYVTVTFRDAIHAAVFRRLRSDGSTFEGDMTQTGNSVSMLVSGAVGILRFKR